MRPRLHSYTHLWPKSNKPSCGVVSTHGTDGICQCSIARMSGPQRPKPKVRDTLTQKRPKPSAENSKRWASLMPNGRPRYVRIYDSDKASPEHRTIDRYTVIFTGQRGKGQIITMSADPFHPQGVFCHTETSDRRPPDLNEWGFAPQIGRALWGERDIQTGQRLKLGVRIGFWDLPTDCQRAVVAEYCDLWDLERPKWMQSDAGVPKHERPIDINKVKDG